MFGFVQKDNFASNLSIPSHLAVGNNVSVYTEFRPTRQIISHSIDNTAGNADFYLVIDGTAATIGDLAIVLVEIVAPLSANYAIIHLPANVYVTLGGSPDNILYVTGYSYFGLLLMFDGEKFIQTTDNC